MMRIETEKAYFEIERSNLGETGTQSDDDFLFNVSVKVSNYSASDQCWVVARDLEQFLIELRELERLRQGKANLVSASPEDLHLEIYASDRLGHMAIRGHIGRMKTEHLLLKLNFAFGFEPDTLPLVLGYFETLREVRER